MTTWQRHSLAILLVVALVFLALLPVHTRLDALSADLLMQMRHGVFGQRHGPDSSPTVVIAIDEQTYRTPPFNESPQVLWTPQIAKVLDAVLAGGATVIGFDIVFATSVQQHLPGFDRPFLLSLRQGARDGRIVLGKVQHSQKPVSPYPAQSMVVGHERNIRTLNVVADVDFIIRHIPLYFQKSGEGEGERELSMALELASRALKTQPEMGTDGAVRLNGWTIPGSNENAMRINFQGGSDIPTYSLADLNACADAGDSDYFTRHFQGKVVMLGAVLDVEDRKLTGKRFMTGVDNGAQGASCKLATEPVLPSAEVNRDSIPGVFIHASAVNDFLRQDGLRDLQPQEILSIIAGVALLIALTTLLVRSWMAVLPLGVAGLGWVGGAVVGVQMGVVLPMLSVLFAAALAYTLMLGYRYMVSDQQKLRIRRLFSLYLAPAVVKQMEDSDQMPELGGEMRTVTIWFSDMANFTALSEGLTPSELVAVMNRYFTEITEIIEQHGGFVDKYSGDAVMAVFGAPLDDPDHATKAVRAALIVRERLKIMNAEGVFSGRPIVTRTGINTGQVLVGNVGGAKRFNYTVMGDPVNLASRLEGANKALGTGTLITEETAAGLPAEIIVREIDMIRVKGRLAPVRVFEPLAMPGYGDSVAAQRLAKLFSEALARYRERQFAEAEHLLAPFVTTDAATARLHHLVKTLAEFPPEEWDGVNALLEK